MIGNYKSISKGNHDDISGSFSTFDNELIAARSRMSYPELLVSYIFIIFTFELTFNDNTTFPCQLLLIASYLTIVLLKNLLFYGRFYKQDVITIECLLFLRYHRELH